MQLLIQLFIFHSIIRLFTLRDYAFTCLRPFVGVWWRKRCKSLKCPFFICNYVWSKNVTFIVRFLFTIIVISIDLLC